MRPESVVSDDEFNISFSNFNPTELAPSLRKTAVELCKLDEGVLHIQHMI